jgi:hypothetical protein
MGALAFIRKPEGKVVVTVTGTSGEANGAEWREFTIRNDTQRIVTFAGFGSERQSAGPRHRLGDLGITRTFSEIKPHSYIRLTAAFKIERRPYSASVYVVAFTSAEEAEAEDHYSRLPRPIRECFMRKYDTRRPAYRHEVVYP